MIAISYTENVPYIDDKFKEIEAHCVQHLTKSMKFHEIKIERFLHLRYEGTDCALMCLPNPSSSNKVAVQSEYGDFISSFVDRYDYDSYFRLIFWP